MKNGRGLKAFRFIPHELLTSCWNLHVLLDKPFEKRQRRTSLNCIKRKCQQISQAFYSAAGFARFLAFAFDDGSAFLGQAFTGSDTFLKRSHFDFKS